MPYYHPDPEAPDQLADEKHNPIVVVIVVVGAAVVCCVPLVILYVMYWR